MKRQWRKPTEADKERRCYAWHKAEDKKFYVVWNPEYEVWGLADRPHILVAVTEILEPQS